MIFIAYYNMQGSLKSIRASEQDNLRLLAISTAGRLDQLIRDNQRIVNYILTDQDVISFLAISEGKRKGRHQKVTDTLLRVKNAFSDVASAYLMNSDGVMVAATYPEIVGKKMNYREYYLMAIGGKNYISNILVGSVTGESGVYFSGPVQGDDGKIIGVAVVKLHGKAVYDILSHVSSSRKQVETFLVDKDGVIVSHPDSAMKYRSFTPLSEKVIADIQRHSRFPVNTIESLNLPDVSEAMLKSSLPGYLSYENPRTKTRYVMGYAPMTSHSWAVGVSESEASFLRPINLLFYKGLGTVAVAGILVIVLAFVLGKTMVRPLKSLTEATRILSGEGKSPLAVQDSGGDRFELNNTVKAEISRISATHHDEIGHLAMAFDEMINQLHEYIANLKMVTAANERIGGELKMAEAIQTSLQKVIGELMEGIKPDYSFDWLIKYMELDRFKQGEYLFHKGDRADKMFYIKEGSLRLVEIDRTVGKGSFIGETGILTPAKERTLSVVCKEDSELYSLDDTKATKLFYQDPSIIFQLIHISITRSLENLAATVLEKERIEADLRVARDIQTSVLPRSFPPFPDREDFDIFAVMEAAREVGGDFYDFFLINEKKLCFIIGDVSGKGVPAALFMMITKTLLKTLALRDLSPDEVLFSANNIISSQNEHGMFVTILCAILDTETGELQIGNAGHNPPFIDRGDGEGFEFIELPESIVLGPMEDVKFSSAKLTLKPDDIVFFYTDGVTEAMNPRLEFFSEKRLKATLSSFMNGNIREIVDGVKDAVKSFVQEAPQSDDITMLALQYKGK